jgi:hypothetical protein
VPSTTRKLPRAHCLQHHRSPASQAAAVAGGITSAAAPLTLAARAPSPNNNNNRNIGVVQTPRKTKAAAPRLAALDADGGDAEVAAPAFKLPRWPSPVPSSSSSSLSSSSSSLSTSTSASTTTPPPTPAAQQPPPPQPKRPPRLAQDPAGTNWYTGAPSVEEVVDNANRALAGPPLDMAARPGPVRLQHRRRRRRRRRQGWPCQKGTGVLLTSTRVFRACVCVV